MKCGNATDVNDACALIAVLSEKSEAERGSNANERVYLARRHSRDLPRSSPTRQMWPQ
jgi:hypothetical protein